MGVLSYQTALTQVQDALQNTIGLALGKRIVVANLAALTAIRGQGQMNRQLAFVTATGGVFRFVKFSTATPDGVTVIKPVDVTTGPGRWLLTSSPIVDPSGTAISSLSTGYLRRVMLWSGEKSAEVWKTRIMGQRPACILQFAGETKTPHANQRGALAEKVYHFALWGVSQNLRPDLEAEYGSPIAAEAADDPGIARIMGDLEYLLDGLTGAEMGIDGVDFLMMAEAQPTIEDYDDREFVWIVPLDVRVTVGKEDPARQPLTTLYAQANAAQLHAEDTFDSLNYRVIGLDILPCAGLTAAITDGSLVINGAPLALTSIPAHTFTASRYTYRDVSALGVWTYVEAFSDLNEPPVTTGSLRIGVTTTDAAGVVADRILIASSAPIGPNNQIV